MRHNVKDALHNLFEQMLDNQPFPLVTNDAKIE